MSSQSLSLLPMGEWVNLDYFRRLYPETLKFVEQCIRQGDSWFTVKEKWSGIEPLSKEAKKTGDDVSKKEYSIFLSISQEHAIVLAVQNPPLMDIISSYISNSTTQDGVRKEIDTDSTKIDIPFEFNNGVVENCHEDVVKENWLKFGQNIRIPKANLTDRSIPCHPQALMYDIRFLDSQNQSDGYKLSKIELNDLYQKFSESDCYYTITFCNTSVMELNLLALYCVYKLHSDTQAHAVNHDLPNTAEELRAIYAVTVNDCLEFAKNMGKEIAIVNGIDEKNRNKFFNSLTGLNSRLSKFEWSSRNNDSSAYATAITYTKIRSLK